MKKDVRQLFIFNQAEKKALVQLAKSQQVSQNELIRMLIRDEARRANIWSIEKDYIKVELEIGE